MAFSMVLVARSLVLCVVFCILVFVHLSFFLLTIKFSVLLQLKASDYRFVIFKLIQALMLNAMLAQYPIYNILRGRPFNLKGGGFMVFCFVQNIFFRQHKS